jgi:hypothetical protein
MSYSRRVSPTTGLKGVTAPFREGETVPVTLYFARRGQARVDFPVQSRSTVHGAHYARSSPPMVAM